MPTRESIFERPPEADNEEENGKDEEDETGPKSHHSRGKSGAQDPGTIVIICILKLNVIVFYHSTTVMW